MAGPWLQFVAGGLTAGAIYALVALGFSIIYNASGAINFAQGEFVMIGGMSAVTLLALGLPLLAGAAAGGAGGRGVVGLLLEKLAIEPARHAGTVTLIIITIGVSLFLRGLAQLLWDKGVHRLPAFSGEQPIEWLGATLLPQSLWVMGGAALAVVALSVVLRPHAARQGDARHLVQPHRRAAGGHQHARRAASPASAWRPGSVRWAACSSRRSPSPPTTPASCSA